MNTLCLFGTKDGKVSWGAGGIRGAIVIINIHDRYIIYVIYNCIAIYVSAFGFIIFTITERKGGGRLLPSPTSRSEGGVPRRE